MLVSWDGISPNIGSVIDGIRKTGLMVKDTGRRDSAGLEDMDAFFSPAVEKSPKKGGYSPHGKLLSYKTKFQRAIQSDDSVPMSGTSSNLNICMILRVRFNSGS